MRHSPAQVFQKSPDLPQPGKRLQLVRRAHVWIPTWKGLLLVLLVLAAAAALIIRGIHPFLAENRMTSADTLVVEGWIPDYALSRVIDLTQNGAATRIILTGGTVRGQIDPEPGDNHAHMAMKRLRRIAPELGGLHEVPTPDSGSRPDRDRTYAAASATGDWLRRMHPQTTSINILTLGTHARRSKLLYEKALGPEIRVGVISVRNREYDPDHWWRYSEGIKEVISEGAAYLYARWLFAPD